MNIFAGLKLYGRNPSAAPAIAIIASVGTYCPWIYATYPIQSADIAAIPAASPSSPSIRFTAFVIAISHNTVMMKHATSPNAILPGPK